MKLNIVTPRATEKAYRLVTSQNTYVFDVPRLANKAEIKAAVEEQFDKVKVASVTTLVQNGKPVRFSRGKNRYPGNTTRVDTKKAYVKLAEGKIKVFDVEETKADKKEAKIEARAEAKKAKEETK